MSLTMGQLADIGLASFDNSPLKEVITLGGDYEAENGFWYSVQWINGLPHRSKGGYSAEYRLAEREWERLHGAVLNEEEYDRFEQFLLVTTGRYGAER